MKRISFLLTVVLPVLAFGQKIMVIEGKVGGLPPESAVFITDATASTDTLARGTVKNGQLSLKGSMREALLVNLDFAGVKKRMPLFLDNSRMTITGNVNDLGTIAITGSPSQKDFQDLQAVFNPLFEKYSRYVQEMRAGTGNKDSIQVLGAQTYAAIQEKTEIYLNGHPASPVTPFLLAVVGQMSEDISILQKRFSQLDTTAKTAFFGRLLRKQIDDASIGAIGSDAIDFTQSDVNGKPVSLSSFKGKYVLVDFWASWCGPCRMENPNVVKTYEQFRQKNFTVLGISLDKAKDPWLKAINDDRLSWTQVSDLKFWNNDVAVKYRIQSIPQNFLLDPSGKIIARNLRGEALRLKLCEVLGCN